MRRARIKALAAVPVRKKIIQDTVSPDASNVPDKEQKKEDVSNTEQEQKAVVEEVVKIVKEEDKSSTDKLDGKSVKNIENVEKKTIEKEESKKVNLIPEAAVTEKINSQKLCSPVKSTFQEPCIQISNKSEKVINQLTQKIVPPPDVPTHTGIDIASTKLTQSRSCFMRPTPRLDSSGRVRKNSIQGSGASASESEDEHGKRAASVVSNRIRNDSICSVQSNKESAINDSQNSPKIKTTQKRRMLISESARRLAEARREFLLKHENRTPDRSQLKMYDLIYYNPVTNPMKKSAVAQRQEITPQLMEVPEEENEDDPSAIPAPQVKVGPDGQLIIDEQSLVIEQTGAKRGREILASEAVIEDDNSRSGGFYKKHKRSKDWPNWETFKFYRVLNVVGPDFLLMQTLFPNRTRQEIKQKYKKEERVNRHLVEKALKYHQEFDTEMLEEQLAMLKNLENIENHKLSIKKVPEKMKDRQSMTKIASRFRRMRRLAADSIGECESSSLNDPEVEDATGDEIDMTSTEANVETSNVQRQQVKKESKARKLKRRADDRSEKSDNNSSYASSNADSESDPEVYQVRPTRSGRQPKVKKLRAPDINMLDKNIEDTMSLNSEIVTSLEVTEEAGTPAENSRNAEMPESMAIPNINQMEPGSLVIVSKESEEDPEDTILQVYMVGPNVDDVGTGVQPNLMPVAIGGRSATEAPNDDN